MPRRASPPAGSPTTPAGPNRHSCCLPLHYNMKSLLFAFSVLLAPASAFVPAMAAPRADTAARMSWYEDDGVVTLVPKFKIKPEFREQYMAQLPKFVEL